MVLTVFAYSSLCFYRNSKRADVQTFSVNHCHGGHKVCYLSALTISFQLQVRCSDSESVMSTFRVAIVSPSDPVYVATQKMREFRVNSVIVTTGNTVQGIFT